jgi:hypothetical protein
MRLADEGQWWSTTSIPDGRAVTDGHLPKTNSVTLSGSCAHNASLANNASVRPPVTRPDACPARKVGELNFQLLRRERGDTAGGKEPYRLF